MWPASRRGRSTRWSSRSGCRVSKSEVSRICQGLDEQVDAFRDRPLEGRYPYLWLDAKVEKIRDGGRVVRKALVLAYGVHESGYREVIALDVGEAETEAFWRAFLRDLRQARPERRPAGDLGRARRAEESDRAGARLPLAALQRPLPPRSAGARPPRAAADAGGAATADLHRRQRRAGARARDRGARAAAQAAAEDRAAARGGRGRPARLLQLPGRPPAEAARARTRSSASTARSAAAPTSSASSPTTDHCSGSPPASSSNKTTSGSSAAATSPTTRWKRYSIKKKEKKNPRRPESSPRPEQPTISPTSYTTSWDLTLASRCGV